MWEEEGEGGGDKLPTPLHLLPASPFSLVVTWRTPVDSRSFSNLVSPFTLFCALPFLISHPRNHPHESLVNHFSSLGGKDTLICSPVRVRGYIYIVLSRLALRTISRIQALHLILPFRTVDVNKVTRIPIVVQPSSSPGNDITYNSLLRSYKQYTVQ